MGFSLANGRGDRVEGGTTEVDMEVELRNGANDGRRTEEHFFLREDVGVRKRGNNFRE